MLLPSMCEVQNILCASWCLPPVGVHVCNVVWICAGCYQSKAGLSFGCSRRRRRQLTFTRNGTLFWLNNYIVPIICNTHTHPTAVHMVILNCITLYRPILRTHARRQHIKRIQLRVGTSPTLAVSQSVSIVTSFLHNCSSRSFRVDLNIDVG